MRTCTDTTKRKIAALGGLPPFGGQWLRAALSDCQHGKPMSVERERRMCKALGIDPPQRKRYWRPCLDYEVGEVVKEMGIDVNVVLLEYLEAMDAVP